MKVSYNKFFFLLACLFIFASTALSQSPTTIKKKCPSVSVYGQVQITSPGDINVNPCPTRSTIFTGIANFSGATVTGLSGAGNVSNVTSTANFFPNWVDNAHLLQNTPYSWDATTYIWNNTALNGQFVQALKPSVAAGTFIVGDCTVTPTTCVSLDQGAVTASISAGTNSTVSLAATTANITTSSTTSFNASGYTFQNQAANAQFAVGITPSVAAGSALVGDCSTTITSCLRLTQGTNTSNLEGATIGLGDVNVTANGTALNIVDSTKTFTPTATGSTAVWDASGVINTKLLRTLTAGGTTGAQVINKPNGSVNFAAGASTLVVTNSVAIGTSTIFANALTNDATCSVKDVERAAGSFTIRMTAACTAETVVAFVVFN